MLGWIELIENQKLYKAVKGLSIEDQIFISYIVKEGRTQRELSRIYGVAQQNISKRFNHVIEKIKYLFDWGICRTIFSKIGYQKTPQKTLYIWRNNFPFIYLNLDNRISISQQHLKILLPSHSSSVKKPSQAMGVASR